ncbi:MAG TPA: hypothetical protein ENJ52_00550 [Aliiroseovarius sp.]|nr:hypothetical protein [Aliiroseovarius sp.]
MGKMKVRESGDMGKCMGCGFEGEHSGPLHAYMSFSPACWARYGEILAREFSDQDYFTGHRLLVDACCGQHSIGPDRRARQSLNIHLAALMLHFEDHASKSDIVAFLSNAARIKEFDGLETPPASTQVSMDAIYAATNAREHNEAVAEYAHQVYRAWEPHFPVFRALIERVTG